jgi:hypothetical protein
LDAPAFSVI